MEVDGDRITDDERMDEDDHALLLASEEGGGDYPVGEGDGMMEDSDADEMMGDELQDDEEYEVAMEEENVEPIIDVQAQPQPEPSTIIESNSIPFTSTNEEISKPMISPFPDIASTTTRTALPKPLESPPAPETEMTPVEELDKQPFINDINGSQGITNEKIDETSVNQVPTEINEEIIKSKLPSPEPEQVATTEEALNVLSHNPLPQSQPQPNSNNDEMPLHYLPTVPAPQSILQVAESSKQGRSREPTPGKANDNTPEEGEEYYDDDEEGIQEEGDEEDEEEYTIDATSLPPIIIHLPNDQARYLFSNYEIDPDALKIWLKDRQSELAEASLYDVWNAIRIECNKEGLNQNGALVISEKQMDFKMNEDDINLQSITFLELILLHHGCGLPEPVQLYLSWEESRFITRFNAIQAELEAVKRRSESVEKEVKEAEQPKEVKQVVASPAKVVEKTVGAEEDGVYEEEYDEDEYVEEEETKSKQGAYSDDEVEVEEKADKNEGEYEERHRRRDQRDVKAQYAESVDDEVNTRDLERAHPNWAAARVKPTDALHFEGPAGKRYLNYNAEGHHNDDAQEEEPKAEQHEKSKEPEANDEIEAKEDEGDDVEEEQYDEEEREENIEEGGEWNDGADTIDESTIAQSKDTDSQNDMNDPDATVPLPVPRDEVKKLRDKRIEQGQLRLLQLKHQGLGENQNTESPSTIDAVALETPFASVPPTQVGLDTLEAGYEEDQSAPLDELALRDSGVDIQSEAILPEISSVNFTMESGAETPAVTSVTDATPTPSVIDLTPSEEGAARGVAQHVVKPRVHAIPEEDEFTEFVDDINKDDETEQLNSPVDGVPGMGIDTGFDVLGHSEKLVPADAIELLHQGQQEHDTNHNDFTPPDTAQVSRNDEDPIGKLEFTESDLGSLSTNKNADKFEDETYFSGNEQDDEDNETLEGESEYPDPDEISLEQENSNSDINPIDSKDFSSADTKIPISTTSDLTDSTGYLSGSGKRHVELDVDDEGFSFDDTSISKRARTED